MVLSKIKNSVGVFLKKLLSKLLLQILGDSCRMDFLSSLQSSWVTQNWGSTSCWLLPPGFQNPQSYRAARELEFLSTVPDGKKKMRKKLKITRHPQMEKHWDPVFRGLILRDFKKMTLPSFSIKSLLIPTSRAQKNKPIKAAHTLSFHCSELCPGCSETVPLPEGGGEGREVSSCRL